MRSSPKMTRATNNINITKGTSRCSQRPSKATNNPKPIASTSDCRCLFSYRRVCPPKILLFKASFRRTRSQTASATPEPKSIKMGEAPAKIPAIARQTEANKQRCDNHKAGFFLAYNQVRPVMSATATPIHCPARTYPAARQNIENVRLAKRKIFRWVIICIAPYCSRCPRERLRAFRTNGNKGCLICQSMTGMCS